MHGKLEESGHYELLETTKGHQILKLGAQRYFAVVEGQKGDILVRSDADHEFRRNLRQGKFYLADFDDDPEFNDLPHLFLQIDSSHFDEWVLPQGLPTQNDHQKKLIRTGDSVTTEKVEYHVKGSGDKGREKQYQGTDKHARSESEASGKPSAKHVSLQEKTKQELYELAKRQHIAGRSKMSKRELVERLS